MQEQDLKPHYNNQTIIESVCESILPMKSESELSIAESIRSQFSCKYNQFMGDRNQINIHEYRSQFKKSNIVYHPGSFYQKLDIKILSNKQQNKEYIIKSSISFFTFTISLYFHDRPFLEEKQLQFIGKGTTSHVYKFKSLDKKQFAIKSAKFNPEEIYSTKCIFLRTIQEYCISKLASCLQIGPVVRQFFTYDLIVYRNCIQFCLQLCQIPTTFDVEATKQQLSILHQCRIIHGDIKNDNIMYSQTYQKNVLIDFNCSEMVNQPIGFKSYSGFKGTTSFVSPQMMRLLLQGKSGYVDLYYNDIHALQLIKLEQFKQKNKCQQNRSQYFGEGINNFFTHLRFRELLKQLNKKNIIEYLQKYFQMMIVSQQLQSKIQDLKRKNDEQLIIEYVKIRNYIVDTINETYRYALQRLPICSFRDIRKFIFEQFKQYISVNPIIQLNPIQTVRKYDNYLKISRPKQTYSHSKISQDFYIQNLFETSRLQTNNSMRQYYIMLLREQKKDKTTIKKLYYKILKTFPSLEVLRLVTNIMYKAFQIKRYTVEENDYLEKMLIIDEEVRGGKMRHKKIWQSLKQFIIGIKQNFLVNLIGQICRIYEISRVPLKISSQNIKNLNVKKILKARSTFQGNAREKKEIAVFSDGIIRILRNFRRSGNRTVKKIESVKKKMKKVMERHYVGSFVDYVFCLVKMEQSIKMKGTSAIIEKKIQEFEQVNTETKQRIVLADIFQYTKHSILSYFCIVQLAVNNIIKNLRDTTLALTQYQKIIKYSIYEHETLQYQALFMVMCLQLDFNIRENYFVEQLLRNCQVKYCSINAKNQNYQYLQKVILHFNRAFMRLFCFFHTNDHHLNPQIIQKYKSWVIEQTSFGKLDLYDLYAIAHAETDSQNQQIALSIVQQAISQIDYFQLFSKDPHKDSSEKKTNSKVIYLKIVCFHQQLLYKKSGQNTLDLNFQLIVNQALNNFTFYELRVGFNIILKYYFDHFLSTQFFKCLDILSQKAQKISTDQLILFNNYQQFYFFQVQLSLLITDEALKIIAHTYLEIIQKRDIDMLFIFLCVMMIRNYLLRIRNMQIWLILLKMYEKMVIYLLKRIQKCNIFIRNRVKENIVPLVCIFYCIDKSIFKKPASMQSIQIFYEAKKKLLKQTLSEQIYNQINPSLDAINRNFRKLKFKKLEFNNWRNSLFKKDFGNQYQSIQNFLKNVRSLAVRQKVYLKMNRVLINKTQQVYIKNLSGVSGHAQQFFSLYINSQSSLFVDTSYIKQIMTGEQTSFTQEENDYSIF